MAPAHHSPSLSWDLKAPSGISTAGRKARLETPRKRATFLLQIEKLRRRADPTEKVSRTGRAGTKSSAGRTWAGSAEDRRELLEVDAFLLGPQLVVDDGVDHRADREGECAGENRPDQADEEIHRLQLRNEGHR